MQFLYPTFLFALFSLSIPVIIHLFNFRRYKKIYFTNVRFLTDLQQEQKSRNKLRHLILLLLRMLALASIILAFAHPFIPKKNKLLNPGKKYVSVYIDNSFSMSNIGPEGELLQAAKKHAAEIANGYKEGDGFTLLTNDFEVLYQHWVNRSDFLKLVNEVNISPSFHKLPDIAARMQENFRKADAANREAYFISDFQENMADFSALKADSTIHFNYVALEAAEHNNVFIDSVWYEAPLFQLGQKNTLYVKIINSGKEKISDHTLNLSINGKAKGIANFTIAEEGSVVVPVNYTITEDGVNTGIVSIDDYPITFDNQFYFSYNVTKTVPVLVINGSTPNNNINIAFGQEKSFSLTNVAAGNLDYSALDKYNFIILNELSEISSGLAAGLNTYLQKSGNVLVLPSSGDINLESYSSFLSLLSADRFSGVTNYTVGVNPIDKQNPFFANIYEEMPRNVAMPQVNKYFKVQKNPAGRVRELLKLNNGDPFLTMVPEGKGYLFVFSIPIQDAWSNINHHWLFLPALYKMAYYHNKEAPLFYTIDKDNVVNIPSLTGDEKKIYTLAKDSSEFIPNQKMLEGTLQLYVEGLVHTAGFYHLKESRNTGSALPGQYVFAFNYNRSESDMKYVSASDIKDKITGTGAAVLNPGKVSLKKEVMELEAGINLWKWFIWASLVFLLGETIITRFWK
jgi:hypothetical protein